MPTKSKSSISNFLKNNLVLLVVSGDSSFSAPLEQAFKNLGFKVTKFDYRKTIFIEKVLNILGNIIPVFGKLANQMINRRLISKCYGIKPALFFVSKGESILSSTVKSIKAADIITVNWYSDWFESEPFFKETLPLYDYIFTADSFDADVYKRKMNVYHLPYGSYLNSFPQKGRKYDVVFIGVWTKEREDLLKSISNLNLSIWGNDIWLKTSLRNKYRGWATPNEVLDIFSKAKIAVNEHQRDTAFKTTVNIRVFEAISQGSMVLTDFRKDLPILFKVEGKSNEVVLYKDIEEFKKNVNYYLVHEKERQRVSEMAYKRLIREHSYESRLSQVLDIIRNSIEKNI